MNLSGSHLRVRPAASMRMGSPRSILRLMRKGLFWERYARLHEIFAKKFGSGLGAQVVSEARFPRWPVP
jgi:hypothetical protein